MRAEPQPRMGEPDAASENTRPRARDDLRCGWAGAAGGDKLALGSWRRREELGISCCDASPASGCFLCMCFPYGVSLLSQGGRCTPHPAAAGREKPRQVWMTDKLPLASCPKALLPWLQRAAGSLRGGVQAPLQCGFTKC